MSGRRAAAPAARIFAPYARIRAAVVRRQRRVGAAMVKDPIMRGHIEAVAGAVNALSKARGDRHSGTEEGRSPE
jgi:hypothetical protein